MKMKCLSTALTIASGYRIYDIYTGVELIVAINKEHGTRALTALG